MTEVNTYESSKTAIELGLQLDPKFWRVARWVLLALVLSWVAVGLEIAPVQRFRATFPIDLLRLTDWLLEWASLLFLGAHMPIWAHRKQQYAEAGKSSQHEQAQEGNESDGGRSQEPREQPTGIKV